MIICMIANVIYDILHDSYEKKWYQRKKIVAGKELLPFTQVGK